MPRRRKRVMRDGPFIKELELVISPTVTVVHGDIIKIDGEHGLRFKFHSLVTNPATGVQWVDCFELEKSKTVATEYLRGLGPTEISVKLAIPRTRVMSLLADWRAMASSNTAIHERAREALVGADQQFSTLISKAYEVMDESDLQGNLASKTAAIKVIADIESKRLDALHYH